MALILVLVSILLVSLAYQLFIRPVRAQYSEAAELATGLEEKLEKLELQQLDYGLYQAQYSELLEQSAKITADLMEPVAGDVLDQSVTKLVEASGLYVKSLDISQQTPHNAMYQPEGMDKEQPYETGIRQCDLTYTVEGTYAALLRLRDAIASDPSMCISRFEFTLMPLASDPDGNIIEEISAASKYEATIAIAVYMYAPVEEKELDGTTEEAEPEQKQDDQELLDYVNKNATAGGGAQ